MFLNAVLFPDQVLILEALLVLGVSSGASRAVWRVSFFFRFCFGPNSSAGPFSCSLRTGRISAPSGASYRPGGLLPFARPPPPRPVSPRGAARAFRQLFGSFLFLQPLLLCGVGLPTCSGASFFNFRVGASVDDFLTNGTCFSLMTTCLIFNLACRGST